jgi:D-sedoheptulose 7-phosphate isomerase
MGPLNMSSIATENAHREAERKRFAAMMLRSAELKRQLAESFADSVLAAVDLCETSLRAGGKLLFCGNGGSAADAQHLAAELLVRLRSRVARPSWPALSLALDPSTLTALGNDFGYEEIFARPLRGLGRKGDVLFAITTSGRSPNVVHALRAAREIGISSIGLLGGEGEPAASLCDLKLLVPDSETARVQECHIALGHTIMELLEDRLVALPINAAAAG